MKTLYIECKMGAAGDMLMGALLELSEKKEEFLCRINAFGLSDVRVDSLSVKQCGIAGTRIAVAIGGEEEESCDVSVHSDMDHHHGQEHHHEHAHEIHHHEHHSNSVREIESMIASMLISEQTKKDAIAVFRLLAEAEAHVHDSTPDQIHFHEVGTKDAIADIVGVCLLMEELSPQRVIVSPVHVGSGMVRCAHGLLPVPAPATAYLLQGIPFYSGQIEAELCTPTGAALLKYFADEFGAMPPMTVSGIGYGMGKKEFSAANCVRVFLGETQEAVSSSNGQIAKLECNLDDATGEEIGYALNLLFGEGAKDVFTVPIQMKKNRPGVMLVCLCETSEADRFASLMLRHTSTFGVRKTVWERYMLDREFLDCDTPYGVIRVKKGSGYGADKAKPEYEDTAAAAARFDVPIQVVTEAAMQAFYSEDAACKLCKEERDD